MSSLRSDGVGIRSSTCLDVLSCSVVGCLAVELSGVDFPGVGLLGLYLWSLLGVSNFPSFCITWQPCIVLLKVGYFAANH